MGQKSRRKGANFERFLAKELSQWWYGKPSILRRVPLSGGWDCAALGDVMVPPTALREVREWPFYVEARNREGWDFGELFDPEREATPLKNWWIETAMKGKSERLTPLMIFSRAYQSTYVMFHEQWRCSFVTPMESRVVAPVIDTKTDTAPPTAVLKAWIGEDPIIVYELDQFCSHFQPKEESDV